MLKTFPLSFRKRRSLARAIWLRAQPLICLLAAAFASMACAGAYALDIKVVDDSDGKTVSILLTGRVTAGDSLKVRSLIGGVAGSKTITAQLAFSGGASTEALSIGRFFNQASIRTVIPAKVRCVSPCPLVLVGGRDPVTGKPSYIKYSSASLGFSGRTLNYEEKDYTIDDLDGAVARTQRNILDVADYLRDVGADIRILGYTESVLKPNETKYISNEQALDLGIAVMFEEAGHVIEPIKRRR